MSMRVRSRQDLFPDRSDSPIAIRSTYINDSEVSPTATLKNTGNTCYLNSVLYVLRFTPRFLHNLHHIVEESRYSHHNDTKAKSSSLGRNVVGLNGSSFRSNSTKDLSSLTFSESSKARVQIATEKLHEVFSSLHDIEHSQKKSIGPYVPSTFLQALRDANPSFILKNEQQDAHELLLHLFDNIRETCSLLTEQMDYPNGLLRKPENVRAKLGKVFFGSGRNKKNYIVEDDMMDVDEESDCDVSASERTPVPRKNFIEEDFSGVTLQTTKCMTCESTTKRKELFFELSVPIDEKVSNKYQEDVYRRVCCSEEMLRDKEKFYCNVCHHYEEARRSISFERLPNIMILQQKRFQHKDDVFQKVNTFMPTPLELQCFCEECVKRSGDIQLHVYMLCGIIMHVGSTIQSGHYKAYVRASDHFQDFVNCPKQPRKNDKKSSVRQLLNLMKKSADGGKSRSGTSNGYLNNPGVDIVQNVCEGKNCCGIKMNYCGEDNVWLECNDDKVTPISVQKLKTELSNKSDNSNTPYLLFYEKNDLFSQEQFNDT